MTNDPARPVDWDSTGRDDLTPLPDEPGSSEDGGFLAPDPLPPSDPAEAWSPSKGKLVLTPVGVAVLAAVVLVIGYLLVSALWERAGGNSAATPAPAVAALTPVQPARPTLPVETPAASQLSPQEFDEWLARARELTIQSRFEEASAIYEDLVRRAPDDPRPELDWALALLLDDQAEASVAHARRAVEQDPLSPEATSVLARAYLKLGELDRGLALARGAVELGAGSASAHAALAEAYLLAGQLQPALEQSELALARDADGANARRIRAWLYDAVDGDLPRAVAEFRAAAELEPDLWLRQHELGLSLLKVGDHEAAIAALKQALALRPKAVTYSAIGQGYYGLGQHDRARAFLEQALSAGTRDADTPALLAVIHASEGRCDDAEVYLEQALAQHPGHPRAIEARTLCQAGPPQQSPLPTPEPDPAQPAPLPGSSPVPEPSAPLPEPTARELPLGGRIAFPVWNTGTGEYDVFISLADGSGRRQVATGMHQPAFSPDGAWLAVNGERSLQENLLLVRPDGSGLLEVTEHIEDALPAWSPAGHALAFSSTRHGDRQSRVYVIDHVPFGGGRAPGRALNAGADDVRGRAPAWSDGSEIVYAGCNYAAAPVQCGLLRMPAGPGSHTPTLVTAHPGDSAPAVHGDRVAFMSDRTGNWEIYVVNLDGSGLVRLTDDDANDGLPAWSPDGRTLAFVSDQGGVWAVWAVDADGANRRKLFDIGGGGLAADWQQEQISWTP